jgi:hypothetical protein
MLVITCPCVILQNTVICIKCFQLQCDLSPLPWSSFFMMLCDLLPAAAWQRWQCRLLPTHLITCIFSVLAALWPMQLELCITSPQASPDNETLSAWFTFADLFYAKHKNTLLSISTANDPLSSWDNRHMGYMVPCRALSGICNASICQHTYARLSQLWQLDGHAKQGGPYSWCTHIIGLAAHRVRHHFLCNGGCKCCPHAIGYNSCHVETHQCWKRV